VSKNRPAELLGGTVRTIWQSKEIFWGSRR